MNPYSDSEYITLTTLNMTHKEFVSLSDLFHVYDAKVLCSIFDMTPVELSEVYRQAGIVRPYIEPKSVEGFNYALLWLYLSGRASYSLNAHGKIEWITDPRKKDNRAMVDLELFDTSSVVSRIKNIVSFPDDQTWVLKYLANGLISGSDEDRRAILTDITVNSRYSIMRNDYLPIKEFLDINKIKYRRSRICYSNLQVFSLFDRIRIEACHIYKGSKEDIGFALKGSATRRKMIDKKVSIPIPDLSFGGKCGSVIIKCMKLVNK